MLVVLESYAAFETTMPTLVSRPARRVDEIPFRRNLEWPVLTFGIRLQGIRRCLEDTGRDVVAVKQGESKIRIENLESVCQ